MTNKIICELALSQAKSKRDVVAQQLLELETFQWLVRNSETIRDLLQKMIDGRITNIGDLTEDTA